MAYHYCSINPTTGRVESVHIYSTEQTETETLKHIQTASGDTINSLRWDGTQWLTIRRTLTPYEFNDRFTLLETAGIIEASKTDSVVAALMKKLDSASEINLDLPIISDGLDLLISKGLLDATRKSEIMA